jgi:hypothetical protein
VILPARLFRALPSCVVRPLQAILRSSPLLRVHAALPLLRIPPALRFGCPAPAHILVSLSQIIESHELPPLGWSVLVVDAVPVEEQRPTVGASGSELRLNR